MEVNLLQCSPLHIAITAMRRCWKSEEKSDTYYNTWANLVLGANDAALIRRIIKSGHTSTIEHVVYTFDIKGMSRAVLQELARHRIASPSVESTRYCLKRLLTGTSNIRESLVQTGVGAVDDANEAQLKRLLEVMAGEDIPNDKLKYMIPEAFKTNLVWTTNARSFRNFLGLRSAPKALWEIQELARKSHAILPPEHKIFFEDIIQ